MSEAGVKISYLVQLRHDPAFIYQIFVTLQLIRRKILYLQGFEDYFSRQHAALDRRVNPLQTLWIQKAGAISCQQHSISVHTWNCKITARSDGLCAVANHLAAI